MHATAKIIYDRPYFEAFYADWIKYRSKWRRFSFPVALMIVAIGIAALFAWPDKLLLGVTIVLLGIYCVYDAATYREQWISKQIDALTLEKSVKIEFVGDEISLETTNTSSKFKIDFLSDVIPTPNGVFLVPQTGSSLFVPRITVVPSEAYTEIVQLMADKIKTRKPV